MHLQCFEEKTDNAKVQHICCKTKSVFNDITVFLSMQSHIVSLPIRKPLLLG